MQQLYFHANDWILCILIGGNKKNNHERLQVIANVTDMVKVCYSIRAYKKPFR